MSLFDGKPVNIAISSPQELDALRWAATAYCVKMQTLGRKIRFEGHVPDLCEEEREAASNWKVFEEIIRRDLRARPVIVNTGQFPQLSLHIEWVGES